MLRSLAETALDEVVESCRAAADHYDAVARAAGTDGLDPVFARLREEHAGRAAALEEEIRRLGNLPSAPDADREAIEHLVTRVRAALSHDEKRVRIEESLRVEATLAGRIEAALRTEQPPSVRHLLQQMQAAVAEARESLAAIAGPSS